MTTIGVISDTHARMHPRVFELFDGVDHILHAGDIGAEEVLIDLRAIAPVTAVRGNVDMLRACDRYPDEAAVTLGGVRFHLIHQVADARERLRSGDWGDDPPHVLVFGHSHQAALQRAGGIMLFNPGSAGPRRFHTVPSVGRIAIADGRPVPEVIALDPEDAARLEGVLAD
jgi:putative phosphoesterase